MLYLKTCYLKNRFWPYHGYKSIKSNLKRQTFISVSDLDTFAVVMYRYFFQLIPALKYWGFFSQKGFVVLTKRRTYFIRL